MLDEVLTKFKLGQKESWALFSPIEIFTTMPAATLVNFSQIKPKQTVLDVGTGTGVVAITAARIDASVSAIDLCPELVAKANQNALIANVKIDFKEADAENIPYPDHFFDAVLSQFGHMFAPRPTVTINEMLRVLKPGGTIAFSTWPSDLFVASLFKLIEQYSPLPEGISSPVQWGDPNFIRKQLGEAVDDLVFDQGMMIFPALSLGHYRQSVETRVGPILKLVKTLKDENPDRLKQFRNEVDKLASQYYSENHIHQHFLMTRARKK